MPDEGPHDHAAVLDGNIVEPSEAVDVYEESGSN